MRTSPSGALSVRLLLILVTIAVVPAACSSTSSKGPGDTGAQVHPDASVADSGSSPADAATPPVDASTPVEDAGPVDAGPVDAGLADAGAIEPDAGATEFDAGPADAGTPFDAGTADAGSGVDAGADTADAGPAVDAGVVDAGTEIDAGPPEYLLTLTVDANPNNVLSAVASVTGWPTGSRSVRVTYQAGSAAAQTTPSTAFPGAASSVKLPVLGLKAETAYSLQAVGLDADGKSLQSVPVSFTTSALPAGVPGFTTVGTTTGYTLVTRVPAGPAGTAGSVSIVDEAGVPVWYLSLPGGLFVDFQRQPDGTFTAAEPDIAHPLPGVVGTGAVFYHQFDVLGNLLHTWTTPDVLGTDGHEMRILANGDALLFGLVQRTMDTTAMGGPADATILANTLHRMTPEGTSTFSWDAFDHLTLDTLDPLLRPPREVVDFTHGNSIDLMADGSYLISLRHTSQAIKIDAATGAVLWKLGGLDSSFQFVNDPLNGFSFQHGARELPNGNILLFDDGNAHAPSQSRAVEYKLDTTAHTATLVRADEDTPPVYGFAMGYAQRLPNGHTVVCYGTTARVQEFDEHGVVVWTLSDPNPTFGLYRAYRLDSLY